MEQRDSLAQQDLFVEATAKIVSKVIPVGGFKDIIVSLIGTDTAVATVKVYGTNENVFEDADASTNGIDVISATKDKIFAPVRLVNLTGGADIDGDSGYQFSANKAVRLELNDNYCKYVFVAITAYTSGKITAKISSAT